MAKLNEHVGEIVFFYLIPPFNLFDKETLKVFPFFPGFSEKLLEY